MDVLRVPIISLSLLFAISTIGCSSAGSAVGFSQEARAMGYATLASSEEAFPPNGYKLFVANAGGNDELGSVVVYDRAGSESPVRSILQGMSGPNNIATDSNGDVYVSNGGNVKFPGSVVEYAANSSEVVRTLTSGLSQPDGLALDKVGNVYVSNFLNNTIAVFGPQGTQPAKTITN